MDYPDGLVNGLPRWTTYMDYLKKYSEKKKIERNITPWLFLLIDSPPWSTILFSFCVYYRYSDVLKAQSFCLLPLLRCSAGAIVRHDGWHTGWWVNIFEFIIVCISVFWVNFGSREHANSKAHFSLITVFIFVDDSLSGFLDADGFEEGKSQSYYWNLDFFHLGMWNKWLLNCRIPATYLHVTE